MEHLNINRELYDMNPLQAHPESHQVDDVGSKAPDLGVLL